MNTHSILSKDNATAGWSYSLKLQPISVDSFTKDLWRQNQEAM